MLEIELNYAFNQMNSGLLLFKLPKKADSMTAKLY